MTKAVRQMFDQYMTPNYAPSDVIPVRGEGSRFWDQAGREYIDFAGGIAVTALGHAHPRLVAALEAQARKLWHLSNVMTNEPALLLAKKLCEATFADKVFFANSGAEANEAALKLARRYAFENSGADKSEIISFNQSFHGRTLFTVSVGGQASYRDGFGPLPPDITHLPFNDIAAFEAAISDRTCAVIVEPVQGEGGVLNATEAFLQAIRRECTERGALLILDEVQTGVGRSGSLYAYQGLGIEPDILTTAKALGCGFPIAAMLTKDVFADSLKVGTHGSTFGGNPLACAVALEVLEIINTPEVLAGVAERRQQFEAGLDEINKRYGVFEEIRGCGLLIGCALAAHFEGKARDVLKVAMESGVMVLVAGPNVIRMAPSLIIPQSEIETGLERLERAIGSLVGQTQSAVG